MCSDTSRKNCGSLNLTPETKVINSAECANMYGQHEQKTRVYDKIMLIIIRLLLQTKIKVENTY